MIRKGIKFGMMLQLAVGPMCLLVFKTSGTSGIFMGLVLVGAIALVDGTYIFLAGCGLATVFSNNRLKKLIKLLGCIVLIAFGINTISGAFDYLLLPNIKLFSSANTKSVFLQGIILTASNPLTIIFWSSVFSTQVVENKLNVRQLIQIGIGCVLATLIFLSAVAVAGSIVNIFLPLIVIHILDVLVGIILIIFGVKSMIKKDARPEN